MSNHFSHIPKMPSSPTRTNPIHLFSHSSPLLSIPHVLLRKLHYKHTRGSDFLLVGVNVIQIMRNTKLGLFCCLSIDTFIFENKLNREVCTGRGRERSGSGVLGLLYFWSIELKERAHRNNRRVKEKEKRGGKTRRGERSEERKNGRNVSLTIWEGDQKETSQSESSPSAVKPGLQSPNPSPKLVPYVHVTILVSREPPFLIITHPRRSLSHPHTHGPTSYNSHILLTTISGEVTTHTWVWLMYTDSIVFSLSLSYHRITSILLSLTDG